MERFHLSSSILQSAKPMNMSIQKTVALVLCLAKLHNYCMNANDNVVLPCTASDQWPNEVNGAVPMEEMEHFDKSGGITPRQLVDGGHHFDDILGINGHHNDDTITYVRVKAQHFHAIDCMILLPRLVLLIDHHYKPDHSRITCSEVKNCC